MKTIKVSELTHQAILNYQNYLYQKQGKKWTIDDLINIAIYNDYSHAMFEYAEVERKLEEKKEK